jgi:hypothetical protein
MRREEAEGTEQVGLGRVGIAPETSCRTGEREKKTDVATWRGLASLSRFLRLSGRNAALGRVSLARSRYPPRTHYDSGFHFSVGRTGLVTVLAFPPGAWALPVDALNKEQLSPLSPRSQRHFFSSAHRYAKKILGLASSRYPLCRTVHPHVCVRGPLFWTARPGPVGWRLRTTEDAAVEVCSCAVQCVVRRRRNGVRQRS